MRAPYIRASLLLLVPVLASCGGRHHLEDYDFQGRSVAVVYYSVPAPQLRSDGFDVDAEDPLGAVVAAGGRIAREVEARRVRARLDSAAARVDFPERMAGRTLDRAARYLGARPVQDRTEADYLLEVDLRELLLDARSDRARVHLSGEAILLDRAGGREIWNARVRTSDRITPELDSGGALGDILTAGSLRTLDVDELERVLTRLADYAAERIARELRSDLRRARER